ncbi:hypothetical protein EJ04DRAFT_502107 [Polyplosphaeria fusca]|uniref:AA9 family lytic polysaccharide monooxygenase n=1 Tax=Polyplosphaeria fusca TaxID=682080 RepID=A0A9P4UYV0_9PLEO|nr:hypothetical protein EJ04DRAFT_502107 [Polyplosphaeria fusca]
MKNLATLAIAALLPALSVAHYHFPHLILNTKVTGAHEYVRPSDNGYMPSWEDGAFLQNPDIRCNKGSMNHRKEPKTAKITAGKDIVGFQTNVQAHIQHPGPLTVYMSKAPGDVRDYDGSGDWFKVFQLGTTPKWNGTDQGWLSWNRYQFRFQLPAQIPAGQYLMRIEHMAVHQPYRNKEFFLQCAHVEVVSNYNGAAPSPTIKFPGGYQRSDPAIQLDSWANPKPSYAPMPGPKMWPNDNNFNVII